LQDTKVVGSPRSIFFLIPVNRKNTGPADRSAPYLRRTGEGDAETVESARFKTLGGSVGITSEDGAGEVRAQLLHGALEHALAAAAVIRVRVEEPRCGRGLTAEVEDAW
jgi:hypothetical protein